MFVYGFRDFVGLVLTSWVGGLVLACGGVCRLWWLGLWACCRCLGLMLEDFNCVSGFGLLGLVGVVYCSWFTN